MSVFQPIVYIPDSAPPKACEGVMHPMLPNGRMHPACRKRVNAARKNEQHRANKIARAAAQSAGQYFRPSRKG